MRESHAVLGYATKIENVFVERETIKYVVAK